MELEVGPFLLRKTFEIPRHFTKSMTLCCLPVNAMVVLVGDLRNLTADLVNRNRRTPDEMSDKSVAQLGEQTIATSSCDFLYSHKIHAWYIYLHLP